MATVTILGTTVITTATGAKTITATPALDDVIVIIGANTGRPTADAPVITDNNADGHGTYVEIATATKNASADSMWAFVRADAVQRAASTVFTFTPSAVGGTDTGGGFAIFKVTGMTLTALAAVRQSSQQNNGAAAGTPTVVMAVACLTGNPVVGAVFNATNTSGTTQPTSWTANTDEGYNTPATGYRASFRSSGNTLTTIPWGSTSASAYCALVVELNAAQGNLAVSPVIPGLIGEQAVKRGAFFCLGESWARRGRLWVPSPGRPLALS